jgi:hypothetical protein
MMIFKKTAAAFRHYGFENNAMLYCSIVELSVSILSSITFYAQSG